MGEKNLLQNMSGEKMKENGDDQNFHSCSVLFSKELLTHYHTMSYFNTLKIYSCGKHCEKRRNCL